MLFCRRWSIKRSFNEASTRQNLLPTVRKRFCYIGIARLDIYTVHMREFARLCVREFANNFVVFFINMGEGSPRLYGREFAF